MSTLNPALASQARGPVRQVPATFQFKKIDAVGGSQNATTAELMGAKDHSKWRKIRVPKVTMVAGVRFEPIHLNKLKFVPGEVYSLPPEIAEDLETSIRDFENGPIVQQTDNSKLANAIAKERAERQAFETLQNAVQA